MKNFPLQTALTIVTVGVLLAAAHRFDPSIGASVVGDLVRLTSFGDDVAGGPPPGHAADSSPVPAPVRLLEDDEGVLDHFYAALSATRSGSIARVVHYGDSPTTADLITGDTRRLLQKRFGNAGHGFILMDQPWAWYQHYDVKLLSFGWHATPATQFHVEDGLYGLGGVTFTAAAPARTHFSFAAVHHSNFEVWFLRQPGGGSLTVSSGGRSLGEIDTAADSSLAGFARVEADPPVSEFDVKVERGSVRAFGVVAETGAAGVVYDSLGLNGGATSVLARIFRLSHWTEELRHRNPDLVVINYGTNEADFGDFIETEYESELREAIRRVHAALPKASVLIMSPLDRGRWTAAGTIETLPTIPRIVEIQGRVARATRCGFFNTFAATGGTGTAARWYASNPRLIGDDLIHPHSGGAKIIANALVREFLAGWERFKNRANSADTGTPEAPQ
jgi:lysophospholipase L1-like esterase